MSTIREKSTIQVIAFWTIPAVLVLAILRAQLFPNPGQSDFSITVLTAVLVVAWVVHAIGMIVNAVKHSRTGWVVSMFVFGPFASVPYYFLKCDINYPSVGNEKP